MGTNTAATAEACVEFTRTLCRTWPVTGSVELKSVIFGGVEGNATIDAVLINSIVDAVLDGQIRLIRQAERTKIIQLISARSALSAQPVPGGEDV